MEKSTTAAGVVPAAIVEEAWQQVGASFERFCLTAGIATLAGMMKADAARLCGERYGRGKGRDGHRWGRTKGKLGFHGGKIELERPRVRVRDGGEIALPSWEAAMAEDWLGKSGGQRCGPFEVGGLAPMRRSVGRTHERVDGLRPVKAEPTGDPDRWHPHRGRSGATGRRRR